MALAFSEFFIIFASVTICSVIFKDGCELLSNLVLRFIIDYLFVSVLKITPNGCEPLGSFFFRLFLTNRVKKSKNPCINQFFCLPLPSEIEKDMIRITEAITYAKEKGLLGKKQKAELAQALWPNSTARAAYMNFLNLETGKSKKIDVATVPVLCNMLGVSADYLFGLTDTPNYSEKQQAIADKAREIVTLASAV